MPYIFPKRKLSTGDVLDPLDLNEDILPAVELYSGVINEHNLQAGGSSGLSSLTDNNIESNAFYTFIDEVLVVDPDFGTTKPFDVPQTTNIEEEDKVINDAGWSAIPFDSASLPGGRGVTAVTTTDNNAAVWIESLIQYAPSPLVYERLLDVNATVSFSGGQYRFQVGGQIGARIQFAIRLDGAVLPWTITGHEDPYHASPRGEKPSVAYVISSRSKLLPNQPGPRIDQDSDLGMMGNFCYPVRLGALVNLTAGRHRIELVARRLPRVDQTTEFSSKDVISIYTRRLFAIQIPQIPRASATFDSIEVVPFDSESELSQSTLTNTVNATRDKFNAVKSGALARAALRSEHLPAPHLGFRTSVRDSSTEFGISAEYPGFPASGSAAAAAVDINPGFQRIPDLEVSLTVTHTVAGQTSKVLVYADVHVRDLYRRPTAQFHAEDVLGALAIAVSTDGGANWEVRDDSFVFFNKSQRTEFSKAALTSPAEVYDRVNMNIPLLTVIPVSSTTTFEIAVVGTKIPTEATNSTVNEMVILRGSISALALRN